VPLISPDVINGLFQLGCAALELYDIRILRQDKAVRGLHWSTILFFIIWNCWSIAYYVLLSQWFSLFSDFILFCTNILWLWLLIKYRRR